MENLYERVMKYQLVLPFCGDSLADYDAMITLEDALIDQLRGIAKVDGHDMGSGERNIFILTSDPAGSFHRARPLLVRRHQLQSVTAAFREIEGEQFKLIWPEDSDEEFRVK